MRGECAMPLEEQLHEAKTKVSRAIKTAMINQGISQADIAKELHVDRGIISRAVNGDNNPQSVSIRKTIYKILGMND